MRSLSRQTLLTIALAVALGGAIASSASATPVYTTTSNSFPFATPIGSRLTAQSTNWTFTLGVFGFSMTCNHATYSDSIGSTNTQRRVVSYVVGNGSGSSCRALFGSFTGTVSGDRFVCGASASNPWLAHITRQISPAPRNPSRRPSFAGTLYLAGSCSFTVILSGRYVCSIVMHSGVSISLGDTTEATTTAIGTAGGARPSVSISGRTCLFSGSTLADLSAVYTYSANPEHVIT